MTTAKKATAAKKSSKVVKTAVTTPVANSDTATMKLFHQADAWAREVYPEPNWTLPDFVSQLRAGMATAMNIYAGAYCRGWELVKSAAVEPMQTAAMRNVLGELTEDDILAANNEALTCADVVGLPLSPRAALVHVQQSLEIHARLVRQPYMQSDRLLTMTDLENYFHNAYFPNAMIAAFVNGNTLPVADVVRAIIASTQRGTHQVYDLTKPQDILDGVFSDKKRGDVWSVMRKLLIVTSHYDYESPELKQLAQAIETLPFPSKLNSVLNHLLASLNE